MRPIGRGLVAGMVALLATTMAVGCSGDDPPKVHTIGLLRAAPGSPAEQELFSSLRAAGFPRSQLRVLAEDRSIMHPTEADATKVVRDWRKQGVEIIFALSTTGAKVAAQAAPDIPVLFLSNDPKATGLVKDLRHPEGNLTGLSYRVPADRTLSVASDALGELHRIGCLVAIDDPAAPPARAELLAGGRSLGIAVQCASFHGADDAAAAAGEILASGVDAIVLVNSPTLVRAIPQLAPVLAASTIPVISNSPVDLAVLTLEPDGADVYRQLAGQAARLLNGAAVADVPVQDPGHYLLVINQGVARRLGRVIPPAVLKRADRVVP
jgi:putative ABC transport system substrate-binding protein